MKSTVILVTDNGFKEVKPFRDLKSACDHYGLNHRYLLGKITDKPRYYKGYLIKKEIIG